MPIPARVKKRLVPTEEMKGRGIPFVGRSESTTLMLKKAWRRGTVGEAEGGEAGEGVGGQGESVVVRASGEADPSLRLPHRAGRDGAPGALRSG